MYVTPFPYTLVADGKGARVGREREEEKKRRERMAVLIGIKSKLVMLKSRPTLADRLGVGIYLYRKYIGTPHIQASLP